MLPVLTLLKLLVAYLTTWTATDLNTGMQQYKSCNILKALNSLHLYLVGRNSFQLNGYPDSDYVNCLDNSHSISGYCFTLGSGVVSWSLQKQPAVANSSCYTEYITLHNASHEVIFLQQLLNGLSLHPPGAPQLFCDNKATTCLSEGHVWHSHTKHIRVKYHFTHEHVLVGNITVSCIGSKDKTADIFMKLLAHIDFHRLCHYLSI